MSLHVSHEVLRLALRDPFRIARTDHDSDAAAITTVVIELRDDRFPGIVGVGEGYPDRFYGETPATTAGSSIPIVKSVGGIAAESPRIA